MVKTVTPVVHAFGAYLHVPDLDLYYAFVNYYKNKVVDKYDHYITDRHGRKFHFWSKQGGLINPKTGKPVFEYNLHWQSNDKASKCHIAIKPLFGAGTKTTKGKTLNLPYIGVNIQVNSSYFELSDILDIYEDVLEEIDAMRFDNKIDRKKSTIFQMELHARYHEKHEGDVVNMLRAIEDRSTMRGDSHLHKDVAQGKYQMFKIDIPSFDVCGIDTKYKHGVKSYRINNFLKRNPLDPLIHPKFEVYLNRSEQKRQPNGYPRLDEYLEVKKDLNNLLIKLLHFAGDDFTYVPDSYFAGHVSEHRGEPLKKWNYEKLADYPKLKLNDDSKANAGLRFLGFIAFKREGSATLQDIVKYTGIPERSVWRYLNYYKKENLLESHRAKETIISFKRKGAWHMVRDALIKLSTLLDFGYTNFYGFVIQNTGKPIGDLFKNIKKDVVFQHDDSVLRCNSHQHANEVHRELKKAGLTRKISVISGSPRRHPY